MKKEPVGKVVSVEYRFRLLSGEEKQFRVELDEEALEQLRPPSTTLPDWTRLTQHQCPNCPLDPAQHPHCPVAVSLVGLVEAFCEGVSYEEADIHVRFGDREYSKRTALQYGVSSLMGLHMVTSGCPVLDKLRPMAHTHLPFASVRETLYRILSMYLLAQYFIQEEGGHPDWKLAKLPQIFEEISLVNKFFCRRLGEVTRMSDAVNNALVNLDCFAMVTTLPPGSLLNEMKEMFQAWREDGRPGATRPDP
jgi:hypothetical protein